MPSRTWCLTIALLVLATAGACAAPSLVLASGGRANYVIVTADRPTRPVAHAAAELARFLGEITGAEFPVVKESEYRQPLAHTREETGKAIFVGLSAAARRVQPGATLAGLGKEGLVIETAGPHLLLYGGEPRGTLYAVYTFLEDYLGCRWWTSTASTIPKRDTIILPALNDRQVPILEYREPFFFDAFDGDWAVRNKVNGMRARLDAERGGQTVYQGFVHTAFQLVPPEKYFDSHPEWFQMKDGKREKERVRQLCMTNPELRAFVAERVKEWLRGNPRATIVSVSQTDDPGYCDCPTCHAVNEREGSPAGSLIEFVNAVAREVHREFPGVAVDTLAYQNTRKPPRHVRPDPGVIVRLCSIECDFARPMTDPANAPFYRDLVGWGKICKRLYVWDYVTNFNHFMRPQPVVHVLGPNVKTFVANNVKGIFEQGSYTSPGGDMAELKAWLLAKMLWNPKRDPERLITEFLHGYYGPAAPYVRAYLEAMRRDTTEHNFWAGCGLETDTGFPTYEALTASVTAMRRAAEAVKGHPDLEARVRRAAVPVLYSWFFRPDLQARARAEGFQWCPGNDFFAGVAQYAAICRENGVTDYAEGRRLERQLETFTGYGRHPAASPVGFEHAVGLIDLQDFLLRTRQATATLCADPTASDGVSLVTSGRSGEINCQLWFGQNPGGAGPYRCYAAVKCDLAAPAQGKVFEVGLYDPVKDEDVISKPVPAGEVRPGEWQVFEIGTANLTAARETPTLWVGLAGNTALKSLAVDRFFLVPE